MIKCLKHLFIVGFVFTFVSCSDDFCVDNTTPQIIFRLYDNTDNTLTKELSLSVSANDLDTFTEITTDSIAIPLDTNATSVIYKFTNEGNEETITVNYSVEDVFVSRACGYKSVFNNISITPTTSSWLQSTELVSTSITNENQAHVKIFH
ncbi:DUF6452 family protein [Flavobacteriaceae bacterium]|nr:DUF6452 family protein [Flavobacteriaceae bacterium]